MSSPSDERDVAIAWDKSAKGRGNRWRMMRDLVAVLAMRPLNLTQTQDALMRLRGITRAKTHQMMGELERAGDIKPTSGTISGEIIMGYSATSKGIHFWIPKGRKTIPAGIVRVLPTMLPVVKSDPQDPQEHQDHQDPNQGGDAD